jgi:flagellar basal-body rod modification protein FlgD
MATTFDSTLSNLGIKRSGAEGVKTITRAQQQQMDQGDFLQLMTAQMKNQDPFNPVDNTQMVAQMAQFSSLAGISQMNTTLQNLSDKLTGTSLNDALGYVGKTVLTAGNTAYPRSSGGIAGAVNLAGDASSVSVTIKNANGQVLRTIDMGAQKEGAVAFDWDGKTDSGEAAGDGPFTVSVAARDAKGSVSAQPLVWAPVQSVAMGSDGKPQLTVTGVGQISTSAVWQVG